MSSISKKWSILRPIFQSTRCKSTKTTSPVQLRRQPSVNPVSRPVSINLEKQLNKKRSNNYLFSQPGIGPGGLFFNPPSAEPDIADTPSLFLPQQDQSYDERQQHNKEATTNLDPNLPPPLSPIRNKSYHLTIEDCLEIQRLRNEDPYKNTRKSLSKKFNCSQFFVGMVANCPTHRLQDMTNRLETIKSRWRPKSAESHRQRLIRSKLIASDQY